MPVLSSTTNQPHCHISGPLPLSPVINLSRVNPAEFLMEVDYPHCPVPDLQSITACSFYWGKMDSSEAERLLENKQEGTFLLRDSGQEEFLFSVSFRQKGCTVHTRIEQSDDKFTFDAQDPNTYTSKTICGLLEHYKDPSVPGPIFTIPLHRNFVFPLQHLCRALMPPLNYESSKQCV